MYPNNNYPSSMHNASAPFSPPNISNGIQASAIYPTLPQATLPNPAGYQQTGYNIPNQPGYPSSNSNQPGYPAYNQNYQPHQTINQPIGYNSSGYANNPQGYPPNQPGYQAGYSSGQGYNNNRQ